MPLKCTSMPQIKEAFVGSQRKHKIYITMSIRVLFWCLLYRHNIFKKVASLFVLSLLISDFTFVFLLLSLLVSGQPDISKFFFSYHEWKQLFTQKCATNYQTYLEKQLNNFWTWNNSLNEISHRWFCRMDKNCMNTDRGSGVWYSESCCNKTLSGEIVSIRS
jgi:hypothetical protein